MKNIYVLLTVVSLMSVAVSSCSKDSIEADKEGIEVRMRNEDNGGDIIDLLRVDSIAMFYIYSNGSTQYEKNWVQFAMSNSNNFIINTGSGYTNAGVCDISCVGNVSGLSGVKNIPDGGWTDQIAVQPGYGYVIRLHNDKSTSEEYGDHRITFRKFCRYARVYVEEWILGIDGGILGATIRYQDNWKIEE